VREFWNRRSRKGKAAIIVGVIIVAIAIIGALAPADDGPTGSGTTSPTLVTTVNEVTTVVESDCLNVPRATVTAIAGGLTTQGRGTLRSAAAALAETNADFRGVEMRVYLLSADIQAAGLEGGGDIATWVMTRSLEAGDGLILAVDAVAKEFSEWGADANPGSPVEEWTSSLRDDDAFEKSRDCAEGG
jgi:hypothetical protein